MADERIDLGVNGWTVHTVAETRGGAWFDITLEVSSEPRHRGRLSVGPLRAEAGSSVSEPLTASEFLNLRGRRLASAIVLPDGTLQIDFEGGPRIEVEPEPAVEAWEFRREDRFFMFCLPGGGVDWWDPSRAGKAQSRKRRARGTKAP